MNIHDPGLPTGAEETFLPAAPHPQKANGGCVPVFEAYCLTKVSPTALRLIKPLPNIKQLLEIKTCGFIGEITKLPQFEWLRLCRIGKGK